MVVFLWLLLLLPHPQSEAAPRKKAVRGSLWGQARLLLWGPGCSCEGEAAWMAVGGANQLVHSLTGIRAGGGMEGLLTYVFAPGPFFRCLWDGPTPAPQVSLWRTAKGFEPTQVPSCCLASCLLFTCCSSSFFGMHQTLHPLNSINRLTQSPSGQS